MPMLSFTHPYLVWPQSDKHTLRRINPHTVSNSRIRVPAVTLCPKSNNSSVPDVPPPQQKPVPVLVEQCGGEKPFLLSKCFACSQV